MKIGMVIGNFDLQRITEGHIELLKAVKSMSNRLIVFVIVQRKENRESDIPFYIKHDFIKFSVPSAEVYPIILGRLPVEKTVTQYVDTFCNGLEGDVVLYGRKHSVDRYYRGKLNKTYLEFNNLNNLMVKNMNYNVLFSNDFKEGVVFALNNLYPDIVCKVAVAIITDENKLVVKRFKTKNALGESVENFDLLTWDICPQHIEVKDCLCDQLEKEYNIKTRHNDFKLLFNFFCRKNNASMFDSSRELVCLYRFKVPSNTLSLRVYDLAEISVEDFDTVNFVASHKNMLGEIKKEINQHSGHSENKKGEI